MKLRHSSARTTLLFLLVISLSLLACGLFTPSTDLSATQNASATGQTSQTEDGFDLSQAGLPADFPIYPGAHDFSGLPDLMLAYSVDVDVRTASEFYDDEMRADGWTGFSTGGGSQGECGGDCGPVPTKTPGATPTATPVGWMRENFQIWTKGNTQIIINYSTNSDGSADVMTTIMGQ